VKRADELQTDVRKRFEKQLDQMLAVFPASRDEVKRLDRKVTQLQKKVRALEKTEGAASA
jgi:polyhydroxyalkanoate synthesis regulator phasin